VREAKLQSDIKEYLENLGWTALNMHGNAFQKGIPDLYCWHDSLKQRWVEVKRKDSYRFTPDQLRVFPMIEGSGIWIMRGTDEYDVLFGPPNWRKFLKPGDHKKIEAFENERKRKRGVRLGQA
jgi:hypothetical protein